MIYVSLEGIFFIQIANYLHKIAFCGDLTFYAFCSGPRCGLGELILPENEPGSSIMPVIVLREFENKRYSVSLYK